MSQRQRFDGPGVRHHVMNRGIGKRLMFAGRRDRREFQLQLACAFRREQLEVESFALLGTHFHMLVRTKVGTLSEGMRRVQNGYSRWFNRRNRRDGYLARSRFLSRPVDSRAYFLTVVPYVDFNPVKAGLCARPGAYEGGSARHYLAGRFPPWMRTAGIHRLISPYRSPGESLARTYGRIFGSAPTASEQELIATRFRSRPTSGDGLDYLLEAPNSRALRWIEEKALNADGLAPACSLVAPSAVEEAIEHLERESGPLPIKRSRKTVDGWPIALCGLQNATAGLGGAALSSRHNISTSTASRRVAAHRELLVKHAEYSEACRRIAVDALARTYTRLRM